MNDITALARIINLLNEHGYEVHDHEINESNVFDAVELLLTQLIEAQETPSEYELVRGQLLVAHRTLLNQRAKIAELESRTVTVKLYDDFQLCHYGATEDYAKGYIDSQNNFTKWLAAAGINVEAE